jgi:hypothetical protein
MAGQSRHYLKLPLTDINSPQAKANMRVLFEIAVKKISDPVTELQFA